MKVMAKIVPVLLLFFTLAWSVLGRAALAADILDVRLWRAPDHTRIVFDLSEPVAHSLLELSDPNRLVIDLSNADLKDALTDLPLEKTPIDRVRSAVRQGNDLRVVLDLNAKVRPKSFPLEANAQTGPRLVLDLYDIGVDGADVKVVKSVDALAGKRDIIVAIDAGHGGEDPGASGPKRLREKRVVLAIAEKLAAKLSQIPGFRPVMIRTGDYYVSLKGRRELAREHQADLFVSIHADAFRLASARGASVYALSTKGATSTTAQYLADRENAADLVGGVRLADVDDMLAGVLTDLTMTATLDNSLSLGSEVLREIDGIAKLHKRQVEQAGFAVLKSPDIPSILVETGFISNPAEAALLSRADYQDKMAQAIQRGILNWFRGHPPPGTLLAWQRQQSGREYKVAGGDTLSEIAQRFNVSVRSIKARNGLASNTIRIGQTLVIPDA